MGSMIRSTNLWGYTKLVSELGGDPDRLLERFGIRLDAANSDNNFISFEATAQLLEATAGELGCLDLGLRLSEWQGLDILGPIAVIARNAQTVHDALAAVSRYLYVHSPALKFEIAPPLKTGTVRFAYEVTELTHSGLRQTYELSMANAMRILRLLGGPDAPVAEVSFLHDQTGPTSAYSQTLGCPTHFGQSWCGLEIPVALAAKTIDSADPQTRKIATEYLESAYLPIDLALKDRVAVLARRLFPTGHCTVEVIADQVSMHPRTLQRRLVAEGTRCQEIIDEQRRELAWSYLAEPRLYLGQISGLLGYTEQSSLNRSCQRWFGKTPRQVQSDLQ